MITRTFDEETGIIVVVGSGAWGFGDIEHHYTELRLMIASLRDRHLPVRVLSDVTNGRRQAAWVEDYIKLQMRETFEPGDRLAILAGDQDDKAHLRSRIDQPGIASFTSRLAAEQWLLLPDHLVGVA